ncbi:hypothetical protein EFU33_13585 [Vibrio cholerae]|nr:hypothetical protein [Vibrio cholerae]HDL9497915.1 hypothetical protein [Vibrio cholerae]
MQISTTLIIVSVLSLILIISLRNNIILFYFIALLFYCFSSLVATNQHVDYEYVNFLYVIHIASLTSFIMLFYLLFVKGQDRRFLLENDNGRIIDSRIGIYSVVIVLSVALFAFLLLVAQYGIPILNTEIRHKVSGYISYSVFLLWIFFPFAYVYLNKNHLISYFIISVFIFLLMAYRTPVVILFVMLFILNNKIPRFSFSFKQYSLVGLIIFFIIAIYPLIRYEDMGFVENIADNLGIPPYLISMMPFFIATTEGAEVLTGIKSIIIEQGEQLGMFTFNGMMTFLPGFDLHSRRQLSIWLGRSNWEESTTTSTFIGQFMLEFGFSGVIISSVILAAFLVSSYGFYYRTKQIFLIVPYTVVYILFLLSIHTGFLDPIIILALIMYFLFMVLLNIKNVKK